MKHALLSLSLLTFLAIGICAWADGPIDLPAGSVQGVVDAWKAAPLPVATPAPQVIVVQAPPSIETRINGWSNIAIVAITAFAGVIVFALQQYATLRPKIDAALAASVKPQIDALTARADRQTTALADQAKRIDTVALATPPPSPSLLVSPSPHLPPASTVAALAAATFFACALAACATDTGNAQKNRAGRVTNAVASTAVRAVGRVALASLVDFATSQASGQKIDLAHAAAAGLWSQSGSILTSGDVQRIVSAYSGSALPQVATAAANAFATADPQTPAARVAVINSLAQTISTAAFSATGNP